MSRADEFIRAYLECALWSSTGDDGEPLEREYGIDDIDPNDRRRMEQEAGRFWIRNSERWANLPSRACSDGTWGPDALAGHDFWLTRNGHGAGFWDRPEYWGEANAEALTNASRDAGPSDLLTDDDGRLYVYP